MALQVVGHEKKYQNFDTLLFSLKRQTQPTDERAQSKTHTTRLVCRQVDPTSTGTTLANIQADSSLDSAACS